ncbi:YpjP family protein [Heyndrickxia oleronia]|uniref:YpjP family protein n=1 Tax=Heyndrickxia oleronia TaxID=38875 RepID=UPI00203FFD07|nr:YpjP family protein [Heyndrickxia oleronia]MCM3453223.1 YpjP family protein [Heyndrickxia oleronia]
MKQWLRKSVVILVSILTFGLVTPAHAIWNENHEVDKAKHQNEASDLKQATTLGSYLSEQQENNRDTIVQKMMMEAEKQSFEKFGEKISPIIEDEFRQVILPKIQDAIEMTIAEYPEEELSSLAITETPSGGVSEKIFHIYNVKTNEDIIRFHVRRDHPPMDGYYFNFHYHTKFDNYQTHYNLGEIYWDKNTPPKWMSV